MKWRLIAEADSCTCCVPEYFSNSKRDMDLSFLVSKKKRIRGDTGCTNFVMSTGHRVCSLHFEGGQTTYMNNVPFIFLFGKIPSKTGTQIKEKNHFTGPSTYSQTKKKRLQPVHQFRPQEKLMSVMVHNNRLNG